MCELVTVASLTVPVEVDLQLCYAISQLNLGLTTLAVQNWHFDESICNLVLRYSYENVWQKIITMKNYCGVEDLIIWSTPDNQLT